MSESIFTQQDQVAPVVSPVPQPVLPTEVADLVGEGKKYKSVEDALKSVPHAQKHIQTLESELAEAKEELAKRRTAEQLLDEMKSSVVPVEKTSPVEIPRDMVEATVAQVIAQKEAQTKAEQNKSVVVGAFSEKFGEKAEEVYIQLAKESGLSIQALNSLAAASPNAVLKLAGIAAQPTVVGKTTSSVNTEAMASQTKPTLSARIAGRSTKDMVAAWKVAGEKVKQAS